MTEPNRLRITIHKRYMLQLVIHTMATKCLGAQKGAYFLVCNIKSLCIN